MGECRLCGETRELQNSHIIPRFVIRWMKKTGATPFLRKAVDPDTRIQDHHEKLLCEDCEQIFSDWEGKFAARVFYPYVRSQKDEFEYDEWLYKFALSVSWRLLVSELAVWHENEHFKNEVVEERLETWEEILLGEKSVSEDPSQHHIFFAGELDLVSSDPEAPEGFELYMQRNLDGTSVYGEDHIHTYFKFPRILFFSTITPSDPGGFTGTRIEEIGVIEQPQELGELWGSFLFSRAERFGQVSMSESEKEKVQDRILEDPERFAESDYLEAQLAEMRRKYAEHDLLEYLDVEECPVCFTNHRVVKSLPRTPLTKSHVEQLNEQVLFARGTFPNQDEVIDEIPTNVTDVLVISTESSTRILQFYVDHGWIVGEEREHYEGMEPEEFGQAAWEKYSEDFHRQMRQRFGR